MVEIIALDEFRDWYLGLEESTRDDVTAVVDLLEEHGTGLGFPHSSAIKGSAVALRELRVQSAGHPVRVFYAFDPERQAVLLIGGDKTGDNRFYKRFVPRAEKLFALYLLERQEP